MLDRYVWGDAERISQEAPVMLLRADKREERLGGASERGRHAPGPRGGRGLVGVVGGDADATRVRSILTDQGIDAAGVLTDAGRPTTVKERYVGRAQAKHPQQMLRVDYEVRDAVTGEVERRLIAAAVAEVGTLRHRAGQRLRQGRLHAGLARSRDRGGEGHGASAWWPTRSAAATTPSTPAAPPSRRTASKPAWPPAGRSPATPMPCGPAAELRDRSASKPPIVTLDKDGMALCHRDGSECVFRPGRGRSTTSRVPATW